jgi:protein-S-isoprenylcysteine O-methyltransferase Ste14
MASQLVAATGDTAPLPTTANRLVGLCVSRRVPISLALFAGLILLDILVFRSRPRDVLAVNSPLVLLSLGFVLAGLLVRTWAAGTLRKQQQLATTGPYALVRHPLYFGSFLLMVGFGTLVQDPISLWVVAGPVAVLYWLAIRSEERKLAKLFPHEWQAYASHTPRFIPYRPQAVQFQNWSLAQWLKNSEHRAWFGAALALLGIKLWQLYG